MADSTMEVRLAMRFWHILLLLCVLLLARAAAQTTQPATPAAPADRWVGTLAQLADALTRMPDDSPAPELSTLLPDGVAIQQFAAVFAGGDPRHELHERTLGMLVASMRGGTWPITTIASSLAEDVSLCDALPESTRKSFVLRDDAELRKANATAQLWVASLLEPNDGDLVAIYLLWEPQQPLASTFMPGSFMLPEAREPTFVLVKACRDGEQVRITQLVYGDVRQALK